VTWPRIGHTVLIVIGLTAGGWSATRLTAGDSSPSVPTTPEDAQLIEVRDRHAPARSPRTVATSTTVPVSVPPITSPPDVTAAEPAPAPASSSGRCGGELPPCYVMRCESGGDLDAENPRSSASGKWQFIDSTWDGYGGYAHASDAPEHVQDERARQVWAGGDGASHWEQCL
jgi:Transglycosylase-like domain